ncbi:lanC-like protein 2 isoform X2 [Camelus ferus]|uniref:LanC-like protein 2 isoform X2 n=2 Tax=Camelus TaxID=9836 RepID=A0A8B8TT47_CAMFR|nr:lanC-like protein 2 isoform X2 [Camelus ferus]
MIALLILVGQVTLWAVCDFSLDVPDLQNLLQFQHCFHLLQVLGLHLWPPHLADDRHAPAAGHHLQSPVLWAPGVNGAGKTTTFKMLEWRHPSDLQTRRHQDTHGLYRVACDQTCLLRSLDHGKRTLRNLHSWSRTFLCGDAGPFAFRAVLQRTIACQDSDLPSELLYGQAGYLYALLYVNLEMGPDALCESAVREAVAAVIKSGKTSSREEKKAERHPLLYQWRRKQYAGVAHGVAGMYCMLMPEYIAMSLDIRGLTFMSIVLVDVSLVKVTLPWNFSA